jgi:hypothetical protein
MPRIPRLRKGAPEAPQAPEAPADQPTEVTSDDSLAATGDPAAAGSGEARTDATPEGAVAVPGADAEASPQAPAGDAPSIVETSSAGDAPSAAESPSTGDTPSTGDDSGATVSMAPLGNGTTPTDGDPLAAPTTSGDPLGGTADPATVVAPAPAPAAGAVAAGEVVTPGQDSATVVVEEAPADAAPGFRARARIRRRLRYLRRYRELAFRDLGGLTFDLHRFGRDRPDLVAQKLETLATVDTEMRALEGALRERRDVTELREVGIAACPRCQTLHNTDANFCPGCGTPLRGAVVREAAPITVSPAEQQQQPPAPPQPDAPT